MQFLREIPAENLTDEKLAALEKVGYVLKWKDDSVEVWANTSEAVPA